VIGKRLGVVLRVVVSVGILAFLLHTIFRSEAEGYFAASKIDPGTLGWWERTSTVWSVGSHGLWRRFGDMDPAWFALAIACYGVACALVIVRWQMILRVQGLHLPVARTGAIFFIGQFFNAFMLGATGGDVAKAWYVARETNHKKAEAITTIAVDRLLGLLGLLALSMIAMAVFHRRVLDDTTLRPFALAVVVGTAVTVVVAGVGLWGGFARAFPRADAWLARRRVYAVWQRVIGAYRRYASYPAVVAKAMVLSLAVHAASMLAIVCVGTGLGIEASPVAYFLYLPIINTISAIPISIGGLGVREGTYALLFGAAGVPASQAIALSLLGHVTYLAWSLVGGVAFLVHRRRHAGDVPPDSPPDLLR
jgi:uncharacterized protein (TIRG00374 family)